MKHDTWQMVVKPFNWSRSFISFKIHNYLYYLFIYLIHIYYKQRVGTTQSISSIAFWENIPITKSHTRNILGVSRIWKRWKISKFIWYSTLTGVIYTEYFSIIFYMKILINVFFRNKNFDFQINFIIFKQNLNTIGGASGQSDITAVLMDSYVMTSKYHFYNTTLL